MSISGLVLTLSDDDAADDAIARLAAEPRLTLGERFGRRVAAVAETPGVDADRDLWRRIRGTPGVAHVDVTFVHLDDRPAPQTRPGTEQPPEDQHAHG